MMPQNDLVVQSALLLLPKLLNYIIKRWYRSHVYILTQAKSFHGLLVLQHLCLRIYPSSVQ